MQLRLADRVKVPRDHPRQEALVKRVSFFTDGKLAERVGGVVYSWKLSMSFSFRLLNHWSVCQAALKLYAASTGNFKKICSNMYTFGMYVKIK